jgi:hypothetical protein
MGMDVYGQNPCTDEGEYFRNNVWYWRPLWSYVCDTFPDLVGATPELGHYNDGYGLDADQARKLGDAILEHIESGRTEEFRRQYYADLANLPRSECQWCEGTGVRRDKVGAEMGMPDKELSPEVQIFTGRTHGWCNACEGIGTIEHFAHNYPFEVDNVEEFAEFLRGCGGFTIC